MDDAAYEALMGRLAEAYPEQFSSSRLSDAALSRPQIDEGLPVTFSPSRGNIAPMASGAMSVMPSATGRASVPAFGGELSVQGVYLPIRGAPPMTHHGFSFEKRFAHGGTVEDALAAVRQHLAGGGFLSDLFSGPDYLSTGEAASPTNWGDPESAADFFKADRALRLAREVQASEPARDMPLPLRRPVAEAAPRQQVAAPAPAPAPAPAQAFRPVTTLPIRDVDEPHDFPPVTTPSLAFGEPVYGEKTQRLGGGEDQNKAPAVQMDYTLGHGQSLWPSSGNFKTLAGTVPENFNSRFGNLMSVDDARQSMMFRPEPRAEISRAVSLAQNLAPAQQETIPSAADALAAVEKLHNAGVYSGEALDKAGEILAAHNRAMFDNIPVEEALRLIRAEGPRMVNQGMPREERPTVQPLAYTAAPTPAPASAAIDQATGKMTARIPEEPHGTALTKQQADYVIRTIAAETSGKSPEETQAIASVILNRINSGKYGATPEAVLFAKRQFEPWMNPAGANYPMKISPTSQRYSDARDALEAAMAGEDITRGATNFWGPKSQYSLGRDTPDFAIKMPDYTDIGATRFHRPNREARPAGAVQMAQAQEVPSTGLFAFGTNDPNPQTALKSAQQIYENARRAGIDPVFVLPNSADSRFAPISEALKKYADERGIKYETPGYDPKDPLHITPDTAKEIAKKYPGALVGGDSNSWRLQKYGYGRPVSSPNAFVDKGTGVKLGQVGAGSPDVAKWFGQYVDRLSRAEGGEVDGYDKGGVIKKAMRAIQNYQDPATRKIADWNWRPLADVDAELGLTEIPPHVQAFGDYMRGMSDKAAGPGLTARDLIKGYTTTRASIQRRATDADRLRQLGLDLPDDVKMIRPEGAWAEWLGTPMGKRYLDAAARGDVEGDAVANAIKVMSPFGRHETDIPDSMKWAAQNLPGREATASDLVARAAQGASAPEEWRQFTSDIRGVGPSKSGFLASLYGRGDQPTLDARQLILNTGEPTKLAAPFLARSKGEGGVEAVDRLAARQSALGLQVPSQYDPFYQHLAHHSIWDKASNEMTTHGDVVKAMQDYAHGGLVDDALHVVRRHFDGEDGSYVDPEEPRPLTIYRGNAPVADEAGGSGREPTPAPPAFSYMPTPESVARQAARQPAYNPAERTWSDAGSTEGERLTRALGVEGELPKGETFMSAQPSGWDKYKPQRVPGTFLKRWGEAFNENADAVSEGLKAVREGNYGAGALGMVGGALGTAISPLTGMERVLVRDPYLRMTGNLKDAQAAEMAADVALTGGLRGMVKPFAKAGNLEKLAAEPLTSAHRLPSPAATGAATAAGAMLAPEDAEASKLSKAMEVARMAIPRELSPLGFYSHGAEAARGLAQAKGTPEQFAAMLQKSGVKGPEMEGFLKTFGGRPIVTQDEAAQYFKGAMPQVEETVLGKHARPEDVKNYFGLDDKAFDELTPQEFLQMKTTYLNAHGESSPTKFGQYTLPGGENYREVLLKLPERGTTTGGIAQKLFGRNMNDLSVEEGRAVAEEMRRLSPSTQSDFTGSHWNDPNVLAHLRLADRTGPNGEKILHVEEIQSDWGQKGKKEGFRNPDDNMQDLVKEYDYLTKQRRALEVSVRNGDDAAPATQAAVSRLTEVNNQMQALLDRMTAVRSNIPSAPYVTNTQAWTDLALKRALKEAAEGGYDKLVWTPGAEQAKRYDLSHHVDNITWSAEPDGKYWVGATKNGSPVRGLENEPMDAKKLEATFGKEIAEKIVKGEGKKMVGGPEMELSGLDLQTGGEGMKGYYDKIVPNQLSKLVKKLDPEAKIGTHEIRTTKESDLRRKLRDEGYDPDQIEIQELLSDNGGRAPRGFTEADLDAIERGDHFKGVSQKGVTAPSLTITPAMREAILKGQTAFKDGGSVVDRALMLVSQQA